MRESQAATKIRFFTSLRAFCPYVPFQLFVSHSPPAWELLQLYWVFYVPCSQLLDNCLPGFHLIEKNKPCIANNDKDDIHLQSTIKDTRLTHSIGIAGCGDQFDLTFPIQWTVSGTMNYTNLISFDYSRVCRHLPEGSESITINQHSLGGTTIKVLEV